MKHKLKITLSTITALFLVSVIPLSVWTTNQINEVVSSQRLDAKTKSNDEQTISNIGINNYPLSNINSVAPTTVRPRNTNGKNQSASQAYNYLSTNVTLSKLEEYVEISSKPANIDENIKINQTGLDNATNNATGILSFNVIFKNYFDENGDLLTTFKSFHISLSGFIKNSSISVKNDYSAAANNTSVQHLKDQLLTTNSGELKTILDPYLNIIFSPQMAPVAATTITSAIVDDENTDTIMGKISFTLNLFNYYESGSPVTIKKITLNGLKNGPHFSISIKEKYNVSLSPKATIDYLTIAPNVISLIKLQEYANVTGIPNNATITVISKTVNSDNNGILILNLSTNKWYENGFEHSTIKTFTLTIPSLTKDSFISKRNDVDFTLSAKLAYDSFANLNGTIKNYENLKKYVDLSRLDPHVSIAKTTYDKTKANRDGQLVLDFVFANYYDGGVLSNKHTIVQSGFIVDTTFLAKESDYINISPQEIYSKFANPDNTLKSMDELQIYVNLGNWDERTKIDSFSPKFNVENGSLELITFFTNAYQNGILVDSINIAINGLAKMTKFIVEPKVFEISAEMAFYNLKTINDEAKLFIEVEKYITIIGSPIIKSVTKANIDNNRGIMSIILNLSNAYDNNGNLFVQSKVFNVGGFIKDSEIMPNVGKYNISTSDVKEKINTANEKEKRAEIEKYVTFNLDPKTKINWSMTQVSSINLEEITISFKELSLFFDGGAPVLEQKIKIKGFATNSLINQKMIVPSHNQTIDFALENTFIKNKNIDYATLSQYVDFVDMPPNVKFLIVDVIPDYFTNHITLTIKTMGYYENGIRQDIVEKEFPNIVVKGFKSILMEPTTVDGNWWIYLLSTIGGVLIMLLIACAIYLYRKTRTKSTPSI